jgi:hypothetical protein
MSDSIAILTSYFSKKKHPNSPTDAYVVGRAADGKVQNNEIEYIKPWYESVDKLKLKGFIFHDNLSDAFVEQYTTEDIKFIKVGDFEYSNNDYRFFCFNDFLKENKFDYVFHADASDVKVVKNPVNLIKDYPDISYFACKDSIKLKHFGDYLNVHDKFNFEDKMMFMLNIDSWDLINMGVVGGTHEDMSNFYSKFVEVRESMGVPEFNSDMWLCQYLLRSQFKDKNFIMGEPVCSEFKQYQNEREDVYFIHK